MVLFSGDGQAQLTLGQPDQPDIESINLVGGSRAGSLTIIVGGRGDTDLGSLTGTCNLSALNASKVNLTGSGIDLDGTITQLMLANITNGADAYFQADRAAFLRLPNVDPGSSIEVDGPVRFLLGDDFFGKVAAGPMSEPNQTELWLSKAALLPSIVAARLKDTARRQVRRRRHPPSNGI